MLTKEELEKTWIRYNSDITEEIFNKIIKRVESLGFKVTSINYQTNFEGFKMHKGLSFRESGWNTIVANGNHTYKEIQVSDILGEDWNKSKEWWKSLKKDDCVVCLVNENSYKENHIYKCNGTFKLNEDYLVFYTYLDSKGSTTNGYNTADNKFRLATPEEAAMYEHAGKPVDVTTYKISKPDNLKVEDLVEGEVVKSILPDNPEWISLFLVEKSDNFNLLHRLYISDLYKGNRFDKHSKWTFGENKFTYATSEETQWLNVCITEGKFIDKNYALRGYDMYGKPLKSKEFVLPEKWCVDANNKIVTNWFENNRQTRSTYSPHKGYLHYPKVREAHSWSNVQEGYTEITLEQFKKYVFKEMKFEKGKWYKFNTSVGEYITRFFKEKNNVFVTDTGYLLNKKYRVDNSNGNITNIKNNQFTEISLEEIQQYLPDDHPDKFKSENLWNKLKVGDYLYVLEGLLEKESHKHHCVKDIIKITKIENDKYGKWITHEPYSFSGGGFRWAEEDKGYILDKHFRKATPQEIEQAKSGWKAPTIKDLSDFVKHYPLTPENCIYIGKGILEQVSSKPKLKLKNKSKVKISKKHVKVSNKHLI